ncbi:MAG: hypothetical protein EDX89_16300 [Acidobacteria bacterium]|nr:MAG: hypothetical protein EDX89_16300 [Acidobacteriota bacterium]MCE7956835.1 hypothetical protein [Acidobacteria bacterium ACB2]
MTSPQGCPPDGATGDPERAAGTEALAGAPQSDAEARRFLEAARALPAEEQEHLLVALVVSLEVEGGTPDRDLEELWSSIVRIRLRRLSRREAANRETEGQAGEDAGQPSASDFTGADVRFEVGAASDPHEIVGTVDGLPFVLLVEGEGWRFAVSPDGSVDPRTVTSNRRGFLIAGRFADRRLEGVARRPSPERVTRLVGVCTEVVHARDRQRRSQAEPGGGNGRDEGNQRGP